MALTQKCKQCTTTGKNLKAIIPRHKYVDLPTLSEPNEQVQLDFAGPITHDNKDTNVLVTIDRYFRYPHAETYNNRYTETAIKYL